MLELVRSSVPPIHPAGRPFIAAGLAFAALGHRSRWLRRAGLLAAGACAGFFRDPPRVPPTRPGGVVAPAERLGCLVGWGAPGALARGGALWGLPPPPAGGAADSARRRRRTRRRLGVPDRIGRPAA